MQLEHICNQVKDKNEVAIIEEYNYIARRHTIILTSKKIFSDLCLQLTCNLWLVLLGIVVYMMLFDVSVIHDL